MPDKKRKLSFKGFWKEVVVPTIKEWLPDILKFFFKNWGVIVLTTTTVISTGGFIYEKIAYDNLRSSVDTAYTTALSDIDKLKANISQLTSDLENARKSFDESSRSVERQREIIQQLQETNKRLTGIYSSIGVTGGAIEVGERDLAELIRQSIEINRGLQSEITTIAKSSK